MVHHALFTHSLLEDLASSVVESGKSASVVSFDDYIIDRVRIWVDLENREIPQVHAISKSGLRYTISYENAGGFFNSYGSDLWDKYVKKVENPNIFSVSFPSQEDLAFFHEKEMNMDYADLK